MKKISHKIVFFGNEKLATGTSSTKPVIKQALLDAGYEIEQHITGKLNELAPHQATLAVLAAYGRIIPQKILDEFPTGIINIHPSLLPRYRGPTPIEQAILDGATETGVSIMKLTAGMDEGPIYKQKTLHLHGEVNKSNLATTLQRLGADILVSILPSIIAGSIRPRQQPHLDRATYCQLIRKTDGAIKWEKPAAIIEREIRAYAGWPKSYTTINDRDVVVTKAAVSNATGKPGEYVIQDKKLAVFCGEGSLVIEKIKPAGKSEMNAEAFINGYLS